MQVFTFAVPNLKLKPTPHDGVFVTVPMQYFRINIVSKSNLFGQ